MHILTPQEQQLIDAISNNDLKTIKELATNNVNLNVQDDQAVGWAALMHALRLSKKDVAKFLIEAGANPDTPSRASGSTALMISVNAGDISAVKMLLNAKANPNIQNDSGATALTWWTIAENESHTEIIQALLDAGADPNITNNDGETALISTIKKGHYTDVIQALIKAGVDINMPDNDGKTALDIAIERGYTEIITLLNAKNITASTNAVITKLQQYRPRHVPRLRRRRR